MNGEGTPLPDGFAVCHWSDAAAATGCTVVLPPPEGAVASGEVRGGGPGTRELDLLDPLANAARIHAVLLTGGSAFGLAAADGVVRWLERNGRGYETPGGLVPLVPAAVVYDLMSGDPNRRPGPPEGEEACEAASPDPALGSVGAGTGAAVGKIRGREFSVKAGVGIAKQHLPQGAKLTALAVVNAFGDVIGEDGQVLAGTRGDDGSFIGTTRQLRTRLIEPPSYRRGEPVENTTLVCLMTDAVLTKSDCGIVAKMAHSGMARAVDPVHSAVDGDVSFVLASGTTDYVDPLIVGVVAAALTAEAIRDACRQATSVAGIPALADLAATS
jgi:L-aminopeptidase/D-esterase-like protein